MFAPCDPGGVKFSLFTRRHHCRVCGNIFCGSCSKVHEAFANTRLCTPCFDISWRQFQNGDKPEVEVDMTFVTDIIDQLQVNMEEDMERHKESLRQQLNNKHDKFKEEDTENKENARDDNGSLSEPKIRTPSHNNVLIKGTTDNGSTKSPPLHTKIDNIFHHAEDSNRKLIEKYKAMLTVETKRQAILATRRNSQDILREVRLTIDSKANETAPSKGARGENKKNGLLTHTTPRRRRNRTDTGSKPRSITRSARRTGDNMSCFGSVPRGTLDRSPTNNMHPRALTNDLEAAEEDEMGRTDSGLATNQPNATDMKQMQNTWWAQELERQRIRDENWAEERRLMQERNKHLRTMASSEQTSTPSAQPHRSNTQPSHLNASCELNLTGLSDILGKDAFHIVFSLPLGLFLSSVDLMAPLCCYCRWVI